MDYLDASILWDWCFGNKYAAFLSQSVQAGTVCTSLFSLVELRYAMLNKGYSRRASSQRIRSIMDSGLPVVPVSEKDFLFALEIESRGLQLYDSIHAALCISQGYRLATSDADFKKLKGIDVFIPPV